MNTLADIRKEFYVLRNGITAETLRKGGMGQKYIFGLQLPQIKGIASKFRPNSDFDAGALARELWADKQCRETRLLACYLMPPSEITMEEAREWAGDITSREEADILAFRLIRYLPFAQTLAENLERSADPLLNYAAMAIRRFL